MNKEEETQLIKRAQKGDRAAFEELLRVHYDTIFKFAMKWCGNGSDAEDIAQNACMKLARAIDSFNFKAAFTSWLYRLVVNVAIDWQRSNARHTGEGDAEIKGVTDATAEDDIYARQVMDEIRDLPEKEKMALLLVIGEGLTHKQAADSMDCKESTVSWYIHEARKKLDHKFGQERKRG